MCTFRPVGDAFEGEEDVGYEKGYVECGFFLSEEELCRAEVVDEQGEEDKGKELVEEVEPVGEDVEEFKYVEEDGEEDEHILYAKCGP